MDRTFENIDSIKSYKFFSEFFKIIFERPHEKM